MTEQTPAPGYVDDREAVLRRLARIEGQVRGVRRMVEEEAYCVDVLTQIAAVDKALDGVALKLLADHTNHCVRDAVARGGDEGDEKVRELAGRASSGSHAPDEPSTGAQRARGASDGAPRCPSGAVLRGLPAPVRRDLHARVLGVGRSVFISDPPSLKRLFGADRQNTIAPGRNVVLAPVLGRARCSCSRATSTCAGAS